MSRRSFVVGLAAVLGGLALAPPAQGLIVVDGKIVDAWPEEPQPAPRHGAAFAALNTGLYPHPSGTVYGLTLLIDFSDATPAFTKAEIDAWLNSKGYSQGGLNGSVRDYFSDESNGMVDFQNEIFGFYRAKQTKAHYESGNGYSGSDELFLEIMDYFDPLVDFSKYDNDGDGKTDAISIVYAGEAETWGQGLWPHASGSNQKRDGVTVSRYMMTNLGTSLGLYTFAHEVGHMLFGWPDLYGFGNYCIMGNGSSQKNPVGINDLYRADQGWIPLVDVTKDTNAIYSAKVNGAGYRYTNPANSKESFFWSNVKSDGRFSTIAGDGLLLLHFDKNI
ncbi:MAG TPA: M6 family metalloprotease domain-containing protein, partial [Polyangiaceae bacterium]|nr:M6 family metalloprotease domain-containing protein [Polyangiaceae bacterium]